MPAATPSPSPAASASASPSASTGERIVWLRVILPVPFSPVIDSWFQQYCPTILRPNCRVDFGYLSPAAPLTFLTSDYANAMQAPHVLTACRKAQADGCDGVLLNIAFDTALREAKHVLQIPVVGALQSAIGVAQSVCGRQFSILAISPNEVPVNYRLSREYQFGAQLASVRPVNVAVLDLHKDFEQLVSSAHAAAKQALEQDGADTLVLGCTGMVGLAERLSSLLDHQVPVLDPCAIGLYHLEDCVRLKIRQRSAGEADVGSGGEGKGRQRQGMRRRTA